MRKILPNSLILLANACPSPLYIVGGSVRDYLASLSTTHKDWDICAALSAATLSELAKNCGFSVKSVYKNTGTVKLSDTDGQEYEFTCFRSDRYERGTHVPVETFFTDDISLDAKRRDFTVNAIYYDIKNQNFVDPLLGIPDVEKRTLRTVDTADKVFGEDGLRLMRLARFSAQLGFAPDAECLRGAQKNAELILDISPERIWAELTAILVADKKYGVQDGHYLGLKVLSEIGVLDKILPELTLGRNMEQRKDFHKYDVLEHSLRAVLYADESIRLAALLHDIGKPICTLRDGNAHAHPNEGAKLTEEILTRLKAPKQTKKRVRLLVQYHMYDFNCQTSENKLRRFLVENQKCIDEILLLKQADFSACMDDLSIAPTVIRWKNLLSTMRKEKVPFTLKELALSGNDLLSAGIPAPHLSHILHELLMHTAIHPADNEKSRLIMLAHGIEKTLKSKI